MKDKEKVLCSCGYGNGINHIVGEGTCARYHVTDISEIPKRIKYKRGFSEVKLENEPLFIWEVKGKLITDYTLFNQRMYHQDENGNWTRPKSKESRNSLEGNW